MEWSVAAPPTDRPQGWHTRSRNARFWRIEEEIGSAKWCSTNALILGAAVAAADIVACFTGFSFHPREVPDHGFVSPSLEG